MVETRYNISKLDIVGDLKVFSMNKYIESGSAAKSLKQSIV